MNKLLKFSVVLFVLTTPILLFAQVTIDTVGTTQYTQQSNGPTGNRIVLDNLGGVHFAWTNSHPYPSVRDVYFNCITSAGCPFPGVGQSASFRNGAGYGQIDVLSDNRAIIAYHHAPTNAESVYVAIDAFNCIGTFEYRRVPNKFSGNACLWPSLTVDQANHIHVLSSQSVNPGSYQRFVYSRSVNVGASWTAAQVVDTATFSSIVTSSRVSNKVAIVYARPLDMSQTKNNIYYIQSQDGISWNFSGDRVNVTSYPSQDSIYALYDYDAIYDANDDLHIIWVAQSQRGGIGSGPVYLYHYDTQSGVISEITQYERPEVCAFPFGHWALEMVSLSADNSGHLFTAYSRFDTNDCSRAGTANGELFAQFSTDNGMSWNSPINISNTPSPDCIGPNCISEIWPSLTEIANTDFHLTCLVDNGGPGDAGEDCSMVYYKIPAGTMGISEDNTKLPNNLNLDAYPNPFNAQTTISFSLEQGGQVTLEIYDLLGRRVATLLDRKMAAGEHSVVWDARMISSGIYYCRLSAGKLAQSERLALIK